MNDSLLNRATGCLLGQLCGDALGSIVEFRSASEILRDYPGGLRTITGSPVWNTLPGQPTDDSELALALAHTLARYGFDIEQVAWSYGRWLSSKPFDIGGTTLKATTAILEARFKGESLELAAYDRSNWDSQANGALMRQSPLAIWGYNLQPAELSVMIRRDTALTHPNMVCRDASAALIVAMSRTIAEGLDGKAAFEVAESQNRAEGTSPSITEAIQAAKHKKPDFEHHQGHVLIAFQNALFQALHAENLEEGIVNTVMGGGDTDTNAAIAGALLGAIYGADSFPSQWTEAVLTCKPSGLKRTARHPRPYEYWPTQTMSLARRLIDKSTQPNSAEPVGDPFTYTPDSEDLSEFATYLESLNWTTDQFRSDSRYKDFILRYPYLSDI